MKPNSARISKATAVLLLFLITAISGISLRAQVQTLYGLPEPGSIVWRDNYTGASGCLFTVGPTNVVASHLGFFSTNTITGLATNHYVGIFSATTPPQLLAQVIVPAGITNDVGVVTNADSYTNSFYWMPLDPPFLLLSNTEYYVAAMPYNGDGDSWGDSFTTTFNPFFVGTNGITTNTTVYGPGIATWPPGGFSVGGFSSNTTYLVEGLANLPIDQARVGVQSTNVLASIGQTLTVAGFASGQPPITYQWWLTPNTPVANQTNAILTIPNATLSNGGTYFLTASNALGGERSVNVAVQVAGPVGIAQSPTNTAVFANYSVTFSCVSTGGAPVSMEWLRNGVPIPTTATNIYSFPSSSSYSFSPARTNNGDTYSCLASNDVQGTPYTAQSANATLTVLPNLAYPQEFLHGPPTGSPRTSGTQICGGAINIGNSPVLVTHLGFDAMVMTTPALTQDHRVGIWLYNSATPSSSTLLGYVTVTNGTPTNTAINGYMWMPLNPPLVLSNNTEYILGAETFNGGDAYNDTTAVPDWNPYFTPGTANSAVWGTGAWPIPPTSGFYGSQMYGAANMAILTNVTAVYVSNTAAISPNYQGFVSSVTNTVGTSVTFIGFAEGQPPIYYPQWYFNGAPLANQTNLNLTLSSVQSANAGSYYFVASNYQTSVTVTSAATTLTVITSPTILSQLPTTYTNILNTSLMTLYAGANPTFSVSVIGGTPFYYQWFTNGAAVPKATNASYVLGNAQPIGATNFYCIITNIYGSATSVVWTATVLPDPANGTGLAPYPQAVLALNPAGYWRLNDTNLDGTDNGAGDDGYICHDYAGGNNGIFTNTLLGQAAYNSVSDPSDSSPLFGSTTFTDSDANSIAGVNFGSPSGTSKAFTVEAWVNGYSQTTDSGIVTLGWGGGGEQFDLDCGSDGGTPSHAFRFLIRDASGAVHSVSSSIAPTLGTWYHLVGVVDEISSQTMTLYINGQNVGTAAVASGSGILSSSIPMSIGARMGGQNTTLTLQFVGDINDVAVFNYAQSSSQVLSQYLEGGQVPPYCTATSAPPAIATAVVGQPMTIPATVFGSPVMGYQWVNLGNSAVLASGTGTSNGISLNAGFSTGSAQSSWDGQTFQLTVTNAYGTTNINVAVTVTVKPQIVIDVPAQVTVGRGQTYSYSPEAVGLAPLAYQWFENGSPIPGANNTNYVPSTSSVSTNTFFVVVTNSSGAATSSISTFAVIAPPNTPLATAILGLQPVAYWPMHEVEPATPGDIETNYGTLGILGNAYYPDWAGDNATAAFQRGYSSAIVSDPDPSTFFTAGNSTTTNALYVPHTSPLTTLNPPFTVELWVYPTGSQNDIWSQSGFEGLNAGSIGGGGGSVGGVRLYGGNGGFTIYSYYNSSALNGPLSLSGGIPNNQWCHVVVTCDVNTNISLYTNGVQALATTSYTHLYTPDYWTPFELGNGRGDTRATKCGIDEVSVYTNALSAAQVSNHYLTGINPSPATSYFQTVANDMPVIYLRMDAPSYSPPPASAWPALYNFGSVVGNGVYTPGTMPGIMPGPNTTYTAVNGGTNVALLSGVSSFADAGYNPVWDPSAPNGTGSNAFSVVCSFRGNPADNRFQCLFGHSDSSWRMTLGANAAGGGAQGSVQFTYGASASSTINCNDGKWHQAVGVYQPGPTALPGTIRLYVDGVLNSINGLVSSNGIVGGAPQYDVMLGAAPDYTNQDIQSVGSPYSLGRQFAGELCDAAVFTNALTAAQVQALYNAAGGVQQALSISSYLPQTRQTSGTTNLMTLYAGASPNFMVAVSGSPAYYQWYTNSVGVGFGTNPILTLPNVQHAFTTYCIATNSNNSVTSVVWSASVAADPDAAGSFSQTILSDNPVAYWRLNEAAGSAIAIDYAGGANGQYGSQTTNGLAGVPIGAANSELAVAMNPKASSEANGTVTNNGIILNTNSITFVCWVLPTTSEGNPSGLFQNRSSAGSSGYQLAGTGGASPINDLDYNWGGSSSAYNYGDPYGFPTNRWGMAVCEITPLNAQFYLYGTNGFIGAATNNFNSQIESFYGGNEIGADPNGGVTRILNGLMNEMAIFNYDLTRAQLDALFQAATNGTGTFVTAQPQNVTVAVGTASTGFTVAASSFSLPLIYQWYYNTASNYAGAIALANGVQANGSSAANVTAAQLTINNVTFGAAGYYFAAATNSVGIGLDSAIAQLSVTPVTTPTNIVVSLAGSNFTLRWPSNWTGWRLQVQTNSASVGLGTNWVTVAGSTGTNQVVIPVNVTNGNVFYRLVYP